MKVVDIRRNGKLKRDIIVIGAPVGGGAALAQLSSRFPPDLDASIFIVLHAAGKSTMLLADVLNAPGRMRAAEAMHDEAIAQRRIYVAADGKHLLIREGKVHLSANGAEHPYRPSIDLLFASAAEVYGKRVVGILLLHAREDGWRGLQAIREGGGRSITHRNKEMREAPKHPETGETLADHHLKLEEIASNVVAYALGAQGA